MSDTFEAGYRRAIEDIRWLASARDDYDDAGVREHTDTARLVADILASDNDGYGWLPSWRWDEWEDRLQHLSPVSEVCTAGFAHAMHIWTLDDGQARYCPGVWTESDELEQGNG